MNTREQLVTAREQVITQYGPWTSHCIDLGHGVYTVESGPNWRVDQFARIIKDFGYDTLKGARILDLACLEGLFAIEFAKLGAETLGIEIRKANIEKAHFAKNILGLEHCSFVQDDVCNISPERFGLFDIVLCAGILYHLDMPDVVELIQKMSAVSKHLLIIDSHIALDSLRENKHGLGKLTSHVINGQKYHGRYFAEHPPESTAREKESRYWASADNSRSFWLTRTSLHSALLHNGFRSVYEMLQDFNESVEDVDRFTFVATK